MQRDRLDFKNMKVGKLFISQLIPTILGMVATALFNVIDGIFVGNGINSDALAAVNISAPLFMIITGQGMMFGMGGAVLASINISQGKYKIANINLTQSVMGLLGFSLIVTLLFTIFPRELGFLLGSDNHLSDMVTDYLFIFAITLPMSVLLVALPYFVRLTNPRISMWALLIAMIFNIVLDYLFIFVFKWGLIGTAIATDISEIIGAVIMLVYLFRKSVAVRFVKLKLSAKSIMLTLRNLGYILRLGFSAFMSEITIAIMMIAGNYTFMDYIGSEGVAAFSIVCYLFPIIFMIFNATVQSAQPIISFNYGCGQIDRGRMALRWAMGFALLFAVIMTTLSMCFSSTIVSLFVPDHTTAAWKYAVEGLSIFALDYVFFGINIIFIGYYTSIERLRRAIALTFLRGILPVIYFFVLPLCFGVTGIWLAVTAGDLTTTLVILLLIIRDKIHHNGNLDQSNR